MQSKKFSNIYPEEPQSSWSTTIDGGPMSISHWGMHDLGRFGVAIIEEEAHWQKDGYIFDVREWAE